MNEDTRAPFVYDGLDPAPEPKSAITEVSEAVKGTVHRVSDAINAGRKPGMPLSILSNIAREAPSARCWSHFYWVLQWRGADKKIEFRTGSTGKYRTAGATLCRTTRTVPSSSRAGSGLKWTSTNNDRKPRGIPGCFGVIMSATATGAVVDTTETEEQWLGFRIFMDVGPSFSPRSLYQRHWLSRLPMRLARLPACVALW